MVSRLCRWRLPASTATPQSRWLQDEYVRAHLVLKEDTSGGAGRISGDDALDKTINITAELLFKPDPAKSQGVIEFSYIFAVSPGALAVAPGDTTRFYAVLSVTDSVAPARRIRRASSTPRCCRSWLSAGRSFGRS